MPWTLAAPKIGLPVLQDAPGGGMSGRVCNPSMPPWKEIEPEAEIEGDAGRVS
jgi:hypothetical protein